jgi:hypothetical protein
MRLKKMEILTVVVAMIIIVTLSSCIFFPVRRYDVMFRNMTYHAIFVDSSKIGNYIPPAGLLSAPDKKNYSFIHAGSLNHLGSIPETVTIKWKKYSGEAIDFATPVQGSGIITQKVKVKANLPKGFQNDDTIVFNITEKNQVILSFIMKKYKYEVDSKGERVFYIYTNDTLDPKNLSDFFKTDGWKKYFEAKRKHNAEKQSVENKKSNSDKK